MSGPTPSSGEERREQHFVLLVHGIRTDAPWAEMVKAILEESPEIDRVFPISYGYFDTVRFLLPGPWRRTATDRFAREWNELRTRYPTCEISVLAHSFGTYAVTRALLEHPHVRLRNVCLAGGIVSSRFPWARVAGSQIFGTIVNDCGTRDLWPLMASTMTVGYGDTGTVGCRTVHVEDRFHQIGHSEFFSEAFAREYWLPLFARNELATLPEAARAPRRPRPWWQSLLRTVKLWWLASVAVLAIGGGQLYRAASVDLPPSSGPVAPTTNATDTGPTRAQTEELDVDLSREFFIAQLGQPRVSRKGLIRCGSELFEAEYARWSGTEYGRQVLALSLKGNVVRFVIRDFRIQSVPYQYTGLKWRLGVDSLASIDEFPMGTYFLEHARFPAYVERIYFGASGRYNDFYFGVWSSAFTGVNIIPSEFKNEADKSASGQQTAAYRALRREAIPFGVAIENTELVPKRCRGDDLGIPSWQEQRLEMIAVDETWIESSMPNGQEWWAE